MAQIPPPPGVGRVGTRGCLHPKWQLLGCRHSGEVEEIHTFTKCWGVNTSKWAYDLYFPGGSKIYKLGDEVGVFFITFDCRGGGS